MNKDELRKKYKQIRNNIPDIETKSNIITNKIIKTNMYKESQVIALYSPINNEVYTNSLAEYSLKDGKKVVYPRVLNNSEMAFYEIKSLDELKEGTFKIKEPRKNSKTLVLKDQIDLIIIPGICFDLNKNRIGYGKGYYDSYLKNFSGVKVGICYDKEVTKDIIPSFKSDVKMDYVITEQNIY